MKTTLLASLTGILLASAAAPAMAHEHESDWSSRHRYEEHARCAEPEALYDHCGNTIVFSHGRRYVIPAEERCHRAPMVVPVPVPRHSPGQFGPPFIGGGLRLIFPR